MTKIQEILEIGLEEYLEKNKTIGYKQKVIKAIKNCKSDKLGAHKYVCDECGYEEIAYNSCRNRHCPNCQTGKKLKWIEARKEEVLNIKYYHVVFTIPSEISSNELDASINKNIDACIDDLEIGEKVVIYRKEKNEINVARSIIIRESIYKKLEDMREKYGISISKLVNIAIRTGLEKYKKSN